jgi:MoaA/NifB/PqqE/SkfB family radical SAM enzyme
LQEWKDDYNPFNTWKILFHIDKLRQIAAGEFPTPVTVDTDVSNVCNQDCIYCNSAAFRQETGGVFLPKEHLLELADMYRTWGIQSTCIGGGGEPTMNKALPDFITRVTDNGIEAGLISNAVVMTDELIDIVCNRCRFMGISLDSCNPTCYEEMRGKDHFHVVRKNIQKIVETKEATGSELDFCAKILIHPANYDDLYSSAKICKELGFNAVQVRPVAVDNIKGTESEKRFEMSQYLPAIEEQVAAMHELEDENFKVFAVVHKFAKDLGRTIKFDKCRATPIQAVFAADGWVYCCFNIRGYEDARICRHLEDPYEVMSAWGGERHKWVLEHIDPVNKCIRCTYNRYNEVIEKGILKDSMFHKFP